MDGRTYSRSTQRHDSDVVLLSKPHRGFRNSFCGINRLLRDSLESRQFAYRVPRFNHAVGQGGDLIAFV
jgi:hypothetical protein